MKVHLNNHYTQNFAVAYWLKYMVENKAVWEFQKSKHSTITYFMYYNIKTFSMWKSSRITLGFWKIDLFWQNKSYAVRMVSFTRTPPNESKRVLYAICHQLGALFSLLCLPSFQWVQFLDHSQVSLQFRLFTKPGRKPSPELPFCRNPENVSMYLMW